MSREDFGMRIPVNFLWGSKIKMMQYLVYKTLEQFATVVTTPWPKVLRRFEVVFDSGLNSNISLILVFSLIQPVV